MKEFFVAYLINIVGLDEMIPQQCLLRRHLFGNYVRV